MQAYWNRKAHIIGLTYKIYKNLQLAHLSMQYKTRLA